MATDRDYMGLALRLAQRGCGATSPNPMVGAVLVRGGRILGQGWHHRAGEPHAEIEAIRDAQRRGNPIRGATLYVTLEPCCTFGRTPPCTEAIIAAGLKRVVVGTTDPNPQHGGRAFDLLRKAGLQVTENVLAEDCTRLNEAFNHWIVSHRPFVVVKAAMTLDGKIATAEGQSKWITGPRARAEGMRLRQQADAILVGINTILADDPSLTFRPSGASRTGQAVSHSLRRIVLDTYARTPLNAKVVVDDFSDLTMVVVGRGAPRKRVAALGRKVRVLAAPGKERPDLRWLLRRLGAENVTSLLVEGGGGEVNASFLLRGLTQRVAFFYAPKILGGRDARRAVAGSGATGLAGSFELQEPEWRRLGPDWMLTARVVPAAPEPSRQPRKAERHLNPRVRTKALRT